MKNKEALKTTNQNNNLYLNFSISLFCILAGTATTLWGYQFGTGNQIEQLPIVYRALDNGFLNHDFFTNASAAFGPRLYFAYFIAFLAKWISLPYLYLFLTITGNIFTAIVTAFFARDLFDGSQAAALFSAAAVLSLKTFWLGASNTVYQTYLDPGHLIFPLLLLSIWAGLKRNLVPCAAFAGLASIIHPLMGLETGALLLGINFLFIIIELIKIPEKKFLPHREKVIQATVALIIFLLFAAPSLLPYLSESQISSSQFVEIVAYLRHPHHYLPGTFGTLQYLQAFAFLIPAIITLDLARNKSCSLQKSLPLIVVLWVSLFLLCLGGYGFVEIAHSRLWTTAQLFRLLFIIKWMGLVIIAGRLGLNYELHGFARNPADAAVWASLMSPLSMSLSYAFLLAKDRVKKLHNILSKPYVTTLLFISVIFLLIIYKVEARVVLLFPLFVIMAVCLLKLRPSCSLPLTTIIGAFIILTIFSGNRFLPAFIASKIEVPLITLGELQDDSTDVAAFARQNTPQDALFIVPPKMGEFRYTAARAIVVDFKAFPFQDDAMLEWQQRLYDCYGAPASSGWQAESDMTIEYRHITDERLHELQQKYGFSYAVVFLETATELPVIFEGQIYKIVSFN